MSDIICVTNRLLCNEDFLTRIEKIAEAKPAGIILREKDLSKEAYKLLASKVLAICEKHGITCILHSFADIASELNSRALHLPLPILRSLSVEVKSGFSILGASCHSVEDAMDAERLGCSYITAGHVFDTDCKKGLPGRGLKFLQAICESVSIPVYAIGGISTENIAVVRNAGAKGACVMSRAMGCKDLQKYLGELK